MNDTAHSSTTPTATAATPAWHSLEAEAALRAQHTDFKRGLSAADVAERQQRVGPNALAHAAQRSLWSVFAAQFKSPLIYLLLCAAVIALVLGEHTDAVVILVVVIVNAVIGSVQEGRAERAVAALQKLTQAKARVVRDGHEAQVEAVTLVPGDILVLDAGDAISADARLLEVAALQVAEAALTGESLPVTKQLQPVAENTALADRSNMIYAGTLSTAGRARAVIVATGKQTEIGHIASLAAAAVQPKTPLERRVDQFGRYIMGVAVLVFAVIVGIGWARGNPLGELLMIAVSTLVGMVPEGLPVAMTIALAVGVQRMARRNAIVRRLSAVETLGSTSVICSDKTGTLTRNEMTVTAICTLDGQRVDVSGVGYAPQGELSVQQQPVQAEPGSLLYNLIEAVVLCNDAQWEPSAGDASGALNNTTAASDKSQIAKPPAETVEQKPVGDPTEVALLTLAYKAKLNPNQLREQFPRKAELPFDPEFKMMATEHAARAVAGKQDAAAQPNASSGTAASGVRVIVKGAPEAVLDFCATVQQGEQRVEFSAALQDEARALVSGMAEQALRVLAVAEGPEQHLAPESGFEALRGKLTLLGLLGQIDPPRDEVKEAVRACRAAGIRPVVVTGDHKATGLAIATQLGIAREGDKAVDGVELAKLSDEQLQQQIDQISVFARVHPAQKLRIVDAFQKRHAVVAMTGDGVNDAPALVKADVGVAMGITGTEVAKESAKIVIADDNFASIVAAVEEGRVVYRNIKKVVLLLFSTSAAEVLVLVLAMVMGFPPPFAAVQILWNNLVTEGAITINLIMEPAEGDEMQQAPIAAQEPLLTRMLLTRMAIMVPSIVLATLGWLMLRTRSGVPAEQVQTEVFTLLAICEWFNVLNCRSEKHSVFGMSLLRNPWLLGGLGSAIALQLAVVYWRPLGDVFRTVPLGLAELGWLVLVGSVVLWTEEARKWWLRARTRVATQ